MSCREIERLFSAGAPDADVSAHRRLCAECDGVARAMDEALALTSPLRAPEWSPSLRKSLLEIPRQTVSCEGAEPLLALAVEGEIAGEDQKRLQSHLSRCAACTEAAGALFAPRELEAPAAPPWLAARLAAVRPEKKKSFWRSAFSGKAVVAYAYGAAVLVMLLGLNPTAVARGKGFAKLGESTRNVVIVAQSSVGDRLGALQEKASRTLAIWKGHVGGYGRAAVSNAIALVLRPEPKKTPTRPRLSNEGGVTGSGGFSEAGGPAPELFTSRFRV